MTTYLFFDLDGTIMVNPFHTYVFPRLSAFLQAAAGLSHEQTMQAIMDEHEARMLNYTADYALACDWDHIAVTVAERFGVRPDFSLEALVWQHAAPPYTALIDDSLNVLSALKAERKLIVATMGLGKYQIPVLQGLGLFPLFDDVLAPDITGYLKTHRAFYARYLDAHTPDSLRIHIGDRYDHDVLAPSGFGTKTIMRVPLPALAQYSPFERPAYLWEWRAKIPGLYEGTYHPTAPVLPEAVVVHLSELPAVIAQIERAAQA